MNALSFHERFCQICVLIGAELLGHLLLGALIGPRKTSVYELFFSNAEGWRYETSLTCAPSQRFFKSCVSFEGNIRASFSQKTSSTETL